MSRDSISLCLAAILNLRNARALFIMAKRHPVRNSQFMKAIRDVHAFFQESLRLVFLQLDRIFAGSNPVEAMNF
jgi:hypothetical protein